MFRLVLLRHGESQWNLENRFTGWWDVGLTEKGVAEARAAGELMAARGLDFDQCFTSLLTRAILTLDLALERFATVKGNFESAHGQLPVPTRPART